MTSTIWNRAGSPIRFIPLVILIALAGVTTLAPTASVRASESASADEARVRMATADRLARSAILTLRRTKPPLPVDYQLCAEQLRLALTLDPGNPLLVRPMREALYHAGDMEGFNEATRQLAVLEPEDTVLQLAVISARITSIQNADDRLIAYERLLGSSGAAIDDSVLSRLAFDAALLAHELGDSDRYVRMLTRATQLDSSNKQAAAWAADYFLARETDPRGRVEILANVILADPLDPSAHLNLAREFLRHGATRAAERFLNHTVDLWEMHGIGLDQSTMLQQFALQWLHEGGQAVLDDLDELESIQRYLIDQDRKALEEAGEDPTQIEDFQPDLVMERIRLAIASSERMDSLREKAMLNIEKGIRDVLLSYQETLDSDEPHDADEIQRSVTDLLVQSLYLRLWSGSQVESAEETIAQLVKLRGSQSLKPESIERFRGWVAAHNGEYEKAERLLRPTSREEPFAMLGLGVAAERVDDRRGAIRAYAQVALDEPGTLMGVWAQKRLELLLGTTLAPTPLASDLEQLAQSLPRTLDKMVTGPSEFLAFDTEHVSPEIDRLGRVLLRLRVRNMGMIPVAVGEHSPVRTSVLMIPRLVVTGQQVIEDAEPEVVSFERRLRLMPRETMTIEVWADMGQTGALLDVDSDVPVTLRWRSILGFDVDEFGQYTRGGASLDHESDLASRGRLTPLGNSTEEVVEAIELAEPGEPLLMTLLQVRSLLLMTMGSEAVDLVEMQEIICGAIAERLATMTPAERAFTIVTLPPPASIAAAQLVDDAAREVRDPLLTILLLRRVLDSTDEQFAEAMASDDPAVRKVAELLHIRLDRMRRLSAGNADADAGDDTSP